MCQWMMKVCLPWTRQDIRTIQRNTIHFQKGTRSTLTRGQIYCQALEILGNRFEIMSENKKRNKKIYYKKPIWRKMLRDVGKKKKSNRRFGSFWPAISKYPKRKEKQTKISKGCLPKKNPRTYHYILSLIAQCGAYPFNFFFLISKK